ncbi:cupin domain-containing protein [Bradyrhizobium sp. F1.13.3]|uniref:JmjC domain-containing protein n=1 Tax=Bradyrhizobium sp. F1.13.3 TaxID=3156351 RepID=UPI003394AD03
MPNEQSLTLEWLLSPFSTKVFFKEYFERRALLIKAKNKKKFSAVLKVEEVDQFLWQQKSRLSSIVSVFNESRAIHPDKYVSQSEYRRWLLDAYENKGTLVINQLDSFCSPAASLRQNLIGGLRAKVSVNAYITSNAAAGFAAHFDRHDVFILQIEGTKKWTVANKPEMLLPCERHAQKQGAPLITFGQDTTCLSLSKGDLLYLPRGLVHRAETENRHSVHITVGVTPCSWSQVAMEMIKAVEDRDVSLRRAAWPSQKMPPFIADLSNLTSSYGGTRADVDDALVAIWRHLIADMEALPDQSANMFNHEDAVATTSVQVRAGMKCLVTTDRKVARIAFPGIGSASRPASIDGPRSLEQAFRFIANTTRSFRVSDLPGPISESAKVVVANRLLREGFLKIVATK